MVRKLAWSTPHKQANLFVDWILFFVRSGIVTGNDAGNWKEVTTVGRHLEALQSPRVRGSAIQVVLMPYALQEYSEPPL